MREPNQKVRKKTDDPVNPPVDPDPTPTPVDPHNPTEKKEKSSNSKLWHLFGLLLPVVVFVWYKVRVHIKTKEAFKKLTDYSKMVTIDSVGVLEEIKDEKSFVEYGNYVYEAYVNGKLRLEEDKDKLILKYDDVQVNFTDFIKFMYRYFVSPGNEKIIHATDPTIKLDLGLFQFLLYCVDSYCFYVSAMSENGNEIGVYVDYANRWNDFVEKVNCEGKLKANLKVFSNRMLMLGNFIRKLVSKESIKNMKITLTNNEIEKAKKENLSTDEAKNVKKKEKWNTIVKEAYNILKDAKPDNFNFKEEDFKEDDLKNSKLPNGSPAELTSLEFDESDLNWLKELFAKDIWVLPQLFTKDFFEEYKNLYESSLSLDSHAPGAAKNTSIAQERGEIDEKLKYYKVLMKPTGKEMLKKFIEDKIINKNIKYSNNIEEVEILVPYKIGTVAMPIRFVFLAMQEYAYENSLPLSKKLGDNKFWHITQKLNFLTSYFEGRVLDLLLIGKKNIEKEIIDFLDKLNLPVEGLEFISHLKSCALDNLNNKLKDKEKIETKHIIKEVYNILCNVSFGRSSLNENLNIDFELARENVDVEVLLNSLKSFAEGYNIELKESAGTEAQPGANRSVNYS